MNARRRKRPNSQGPRKKHKIAQQVHDKRVETRVGRREHIEAEEKHLLGINPSIRRSIPGELKAIRTGGLRQRLPSQLILHHEAERLDELAAKWTDHYMSAIRKAAKKEGETIDAQKGHKMWANGFDMFIETFVRKMSIKNIDRVIDEIDAIHEYTRLPKVVERQRAKRSKTFSKIVSDLLERNVDPEINLLKNAEKTIHRKSIGKGESSYTKNKMRAIDICVAASIYADLKNARARQGEKTSWVRYYQNGIHLVWESSRLPDSVAKAIKRLKR